MYHIRANAEASVRNLLRDVAGRAGTNILTAVDYLDDGSPVRNFRISFFSCDAEALSLIMSKLFRFSLKWKLIRKMVLLSSISMERDAKYAET